MLRRRLDSKGSTTIEFAIVAPVLFLLLVGFIEIGMIVFTTSVLEGATAIGARIGYTGYTADGLTPQEYITGRIRQLSGGYLDLDKLDIRIQAYSGFNNVGDGAPCAPGQTSCTPGTGIIGQVVLYRVTYPWALFTPLMAQLLGDDKGILNITAISTVRNQ